MKRRRSGIRCSLHLRIGGSATGVLVTDKCHEPSGNDKVCALILRSARTFNINFLPESNWAHWASVVSAFSLDFYKFVCGNVSAFPPRF